MSQGAEIKRYIKDPSLLIELCREVIDQFDIGNDNKETAAMEAQLREISKAVEKLEKLGVSVPDVLRAEKTRLAASLGVKTEAYQALKHLADEFGDILKELKERLGINSDDKTGTKPKNKRSKLQKTNSEVLRKYIILVLKEFGGRARVPDILDTIERQLSNKLLPGDLEVRQDGKTIAWRNNVLWERYRMMQEGILRNDSQRGYWELNED
ncbi:hypothetical protein METP3_00460 [Methanosarcinales archaeon]|nr:hypothetical protein METP3_00460 [Methanosarcinales archaeon]